jgi:hypothetical protein
MTFSIRTTWLSTDPLYQYCQKGARDLSHSAVGRLAEADGILKGRVFYNAQSADYRVLIEPGLPMPGQPRHKRRRRW